MSRWFRTLTWIQRKIPKSEFYVNLGSGIWSANLFLGAGFKPAPTGVPVHEGLIEIIGVFKVI